LTYRKALEETLPKLKEEHRARQGLEELGFAASSGKKLELRDRGNGTSTLPPRGYGWNTRSPA